MSNIVVPAATRSVITATPMTTFKVGTYTALTDTFTATLDLNDHVNYWLVSVDFAQPKKVYSRSTTIRAAGERIANWNYGNRHITLTIHLLYEVGTQQLLAAVRSLLAAIENPPYRLAFAAPNSTVLTYADVVAVSHTIPYDGKRILAKTLSKIQIDFECAPGLAGDRITLQNLVVNPGFEAPSGPPVTAFSDTFATTNAYAVAAGSAPTLASNVMTLASNSRVVFGSPEWGAINLWQIRWQWVTGLTATFYLHYTDGNNNLYVQYYPAGPTLFLVQTVGGTNHILASATVTLTTGAWYWLQITQFPAASGTQPNVQATLYNDSSGAVGTSVASLGPVATYDGVTALSGRPQLLAAGASLAVGGAFSNVNLLQLFGPGPWAFTGQTGSATAQSSGAWEQNTANTYGSGPATSYGAGRIDLAPAGVVDAMLVTPSGTNGIPVSAGQTVGYSGWVRSSGLAATTNLDVSIREYDVNGAALRITRIARLTGNQATWTKQSATLTTGTSCAYVRIELEVDDPNAGASANGTVWWDNQQLWNETTTGQSVMPYCELRFPQSPAQLLVSGLQGDMPAPALMDYGIYVSPSYAGFTTLALTVGQRAAPHAGGRLVYVPALAAPGASNAMALDSTVYGGCYATTVGSTNAIITEPLTPTAATLLGLYHEIIWVKPKDTSYATQTIQVGAYELLAAAIGGTTYSSYNGGVQPLGASSTVWTAGDAGMLPIPFSAPIQREDYTQKWYGLYTTVTVNSTSGNPTAVGPTALLPVDGGVSRVLIGDVYGPLAANAWVWVYNDAPAPSDLSNHSAPTSGGGWRYSEEASPLSNAGHAAGGVGTNADKTITPVADGWLMLDPTNAAGGDGSAIGQLVAYLHDQTYGLDGEFPLHVEAHYAPQYLFPRQQ